MRTVFPYQVEDRLKAEFFGPSPAGYFVEVGANAPRAGSQTWQFEQAGWTGVLVEPQPDLAEELRRTRRARVVLAACSSPGRAGGTVRLHLLGPHSSLKPDLVVTGVVAQGAIDVPARARSTRCSKRSARRRRSTSSRSTSRVTKSKSCADSISSVGVRD
jgi:hypothetical protein